MTNQKTIDELKRIAQENNGILRAEDVVAAAEPEESPLHNSFEWNDTIAARRYRLRQARELIRVTVEVIPQTGTEQRVFVSLNPDREEEGGGYRILTKVMSDADRRKQLLEDALCELEAIQEKYANLKVLAKVFSAVKDVRVRLGYGSAGKTSMVPPRNRMATMRRLSVSPVTVP